MNNKPKLIKIIGSVFTVFLSLILLIVLFLLFVPTFEHVDKKKVESSSDWMAGIDDNKLLSDINIPGTHDAATKYVQLAFFSRCQDLGIFRQLESGIRYLDIRLGVTKQKMKLMHGFTTAKKNLLPWSKDLLLEDVLNDCYQFLNEHPTETILFVVKQEYGNETTAKFQEILNTYITKDQNYWYLNDKIPSLKEARGKLVLMRRYSDALGLGASSGIPLSWGEPKVEPGNELSQIIATSIYDNHILKVQDLYELNTNKKWSAFLKVIDLLEKENSNDVYINFLSTKGSLTYGHPYFYANNLNQKLLQKKLINGKKYGWIILDFASPTLANRIYSTNFN